MTIRHQTANDDHLFWTQKLLLRNPGVTQRTFAKEVDINGSSINFCLNAVAKKGGIKTGDFSKNPDKLSYADLLTSTDVAERATLTKGFFQCKMAEYEKLGEEIAALHLEADLPPPAAAAESNS